MIGRSHSWLQHQLVDQAVKIDRADWTDVMALRLKTLFHAWEITKNQKAFEHIKWSFDTAIERVEFKDGQVILKKGWAGTPGGTPVGFGLYLSLSALTRFYKVVPEKKYLQVLENALPRAVTLETCVPKRNAWNGAFLKGFCGPLAVANFFNRLDEVEKAFLDYCQAAEKELADPKTGVWRYFKYGDRTLPNIPAHGASLSIFYLTHILEFYH